MPQDRLICDWIEGNQRWRFLGEIRIGNVDHRSESVISEIGAEDDWIHVRANAERVDHDVRSAIQGRFHLIDNLIWVDRRRPAAINQITLERIDSGKSSLDVEHASDLFLFDQAHRSRYAQRDKVILRFRSGQNSYDSTCRLVESLNSGRHRAVGV